MTSAPYETNHTVSLALSNAQSSSRKKSTQTAVSRCDLFADCACANSRGTGPHTAVLSGFSVLALCMPYVDRKTKQLWSPNKSESLRKRTPDWRRSRSIQCGIESGAGKYRKSWGGIGQGSKADHSDITFCFLSCRSMWNRSIHRIR